MLGDFPLFMIICFGFKLKWAVRYKGKVRTETIYVCGYGTNLDNAKYMARGAKELPDLKKVILLDLTPKYNGVNGSK